MLSAPCAQVDPDMFFPDAGDSEKIAMARSICRRCPYKAPCVLIAIETKQEYGIWGGLGRPGRDKLAKELGLGADDTRMGA